MFVLLCVIARYSYIVFVSRLRLCNSLLSLLCLSHYLHLCSVKCLRVVCLFVGVVSPLSSLVLVYIVPSLVSSIVGFGYSSHHVPDSCELINTF